MVVVAPSALPICALLKERQTLRKFEIEHIGICVEKPIEMAKWYQETLGFNIKFSAQDEGKRSGIPHGFQR
ncbi:Uncharacterised protein [uncultured archaeon]|nr:Uncharacterised protein [uncultured archaeon]